MAMPDPRLPRPTCPVCNSRNVLVVAVTAKVASLYCLACEHLFALDIPADQQPTTPDAPPAAEQRRSRVASLHPSFPA
jgi:hypothetical protein